MGIAPSSMKYTYGVMTPSHPLPFCSLKKNGF